MRDPVSALRTVEINRQPVPPDNSTLRVREAWQ